jgi:hypothetical protein
MNYRLVMAGYFSALRDDMAELGILGIGAIELTWLD